MKYKEFAVGAGLLLALGTGRAGAFYNYEEMGTKAKAFEPQANFDVAGMVMSNSKFDETQANIPEVFGFVTTLAETGVSQAGQALDLKYVSDVYVAFSPQNEIQIWLKWERIPTPIMVNLSFAYALNLGVDLEIESVTMGIVKFPGKWLKGSDKFLEDIISEILSDLKEKYSLEVLEVWTEGEKITFRTRVIDLDWLAK